MAVSRELGFDECEQMLSAGVVGRIALMTPDGPQIVPLNYAVVGDAIIVATTPYSVLGTYGPGALVAFEVDQFDVGASTGWSVVVRGRAAVVASPAEVQALKRAGVVHPWVDGARNLILRIPRTEVSGRRLDEERGTHT
jgi:nitroimidazol reductase NimA-like FMN-containing flavoprotein (pyridoxamine 5'-phosphate oxidase superfamily)